MWHVLHLVVRPIEAALGFFCILTAIVLYPNEEGRIQSKFEDFWIIMDDFKNLALSKHIAFLTRIAELETRILDRIFGSKLFSPQTVGVSLAVSLMAFAVYGMYDNVTNGVEGDSDYIFVAIYFFLALSLGIACIRIRRQRVVRIVVAVVLLILLLAPLLVLMDPQSNSEEVWTDAFMIYGVMLIGFICDILFAVATRQLVRFLQHFRQTFGIIFILLLNLFLAILLVCPLYIFRNLDVSYGNPTASVLYFAALSNAPDMLLALVFEILAVTLLVHRLLWPLLTRTLFKMADIGTKGRRAILTAVGFALLAAGLSGRVPELVQKLVETLRG